MIIKVINKNSEPERYAFTEDKVIIGRNPSTEASVQLDSETISRKHLAARVRNGVIQIKDLNSSNGSFLGEVKLQPDVWHEIDSDDKIRLAQFEGHLLFDIREQTTQKKTEKQQTKIKDKKRSSSSQSDSSRSRSRQNQKKLRTLPFKVSESSLKMFKDMTINKKSKAERIKFLKLMGIGKAEEYWQEIEALAKGKKGGRDNKKANEELERQFSQSRSGFQKRGLGK